MQDEKLKQLCQTIYRKHREAIDLIVQYGQVSRFSELASEIVGHDGDCEVLYAAPKSLDFIPSSWAKVVPENGSAWTHLKRPVSVTCWLGLYDNKISIGFEVSRMTDSALRMSCVKALRDSGYKLTKKAFDLDAKYSRFYRSSRSLRDSGDAEEMRDALESLIGKAREEFPKVEAVFRTVFAAKE